eukprot:COSAG06_NODE_16_length_34949_cov_31.500832_16_plen_65_part_00
MRKRHFLRHLYIKCIILPRQARDEHRENSKKVPFSLRLDEGGPKVATSEIYAEAEAEAAEEEEE